MLLRIGQVSTSFQASAKFLFGRIHRIARERRFPGPHTGSVSIGVNPKERVPKIFMNKKDDLAEAYKQQKTKIKKRLHIFDICMYPHYTLIDMGIWHPLK